MVSPHSISFKKKISIYCTNSIYPLMMKMLFRVSYFPIQRVHLLSVEWFKMWVIVSIVISLGKLHLKPLCLKCSFIVGKLTQNVFFHVRQTFLQRAGIWPIERKWLPAYQTETWTRSSCSFRILFKSHTFVISIMISLFGTCTKLSRSI